MKKIAIFFLLLFIVGCKQIDVNDDILSGLPGTGCIGTNFIFTCGQTINESCVLDGDLTTNETCFFIETNDITIDGNGSKILGTLNNSIGINISSVNNTTIKNCVFESNLTDLKAEIFEGILGISGDSNTTIYNNTFINNSRAIRFENFLSGLNISNNILSDGEVAIIAWGGDSSYDNVVIANNIITNFNSSYYWNSVVNVRNINENLFIYSNNITAGFNPPVLELYNVMNGSIHNNILTGYTQHQNVELIAGSSYNHVYNNTIIAGTDGIFLTGSNNLIEQNNITSQVHHNIVIYTHPSVDNDVANNLITNNILDLAVYNGIITADMGAGDIYNNTISYNNITNYGTTGIYFDFTGTTYGTADNMTVINNFISSDLGSNLHNGFIGTSDWGLNFSNNLVNFSEQYSFYYVSPYEDRDLIVENNIFKGSQVVIQTAYGSMINNNSILDSNQYGLLIYGGGDNIISNNYINNTNGDGFMDGIGISFQDTGNNNVSNTIVDNSILYDIQGSMSQDNNLINCTFDTLDAIDGAGIFVKWYLDVFINYTNSSVANGASAYIYDVNDNLIVTTITNETGYTPLQVLTEYYKTFDSQIFYTNYSINASDGIFNSDTKKINLTESMQENLTLNFAGCMGATQTFFCGDSVTESCTMYSNLSCSNNGLVIMTDNLILDGAGYTIEAGTGFYDCGIDGWQTTFNNITIKNFIFEGSMTTSVGTTVNDLLIENVTDNSLGYGLYSYGDTNALYKNSFAKQSWIDNTLTTTNNIYYENMTIESFNTWMSPNYITINNSNIIFGNYMSDDTNYFGIYNSNISGFSTSSNHVILNNNTITGNIGFGTTSYNSIINNYFLTNSPITFQQSGGGGGGGDSSFSNITDNIFECVGENGIGITIGDDNNLIERNNISNCYKGILLAITSYENNLSDNYIYNSYFGFIIGGENNTIKNNVMENITEQGLSLEDLSFYFNYMQNNTVDGNMHHHCYLNNSFVFENMNLNYTRTSSHGSLTMGKCNNAQIINLSLGDGNDDIIGFNTVDNLTIKNSNIKGGIYLISVTNSMIENNIFRDTIRSGIWDTSNGNGWINVTVRNNTFSNIYGRGIWSDMDGGNNTFYNNLFNKTWIAISNADINYGMTKTHDNNFYDTTMAIGTSQMEIYDNNFTNIKIGIAVSDYFTSIIYNNNFISTEKPFYYLTLSDVQNNTINWGVIPALINLSNNTYIVSINQTANISFIKNEIVGYGNISSINISLFPAYNYTLTNDSENYTIEFTPTKKGIAMILVNITTANGNEENYKIPILTNLNSKSKIMYVNSAEPTTEVIFKTNSGDLGTTHETYLINQSIYCSEWLIGFTDKELTLIPSVITDINVAECTFSNRFIGFGKHISYQGGGGEFATIEYMGQAQTGDWKYFIGNLTNLNWMISNTREWLYTAVYNSIQTGWLYSENENCEGISYINMSYLSQNEFEINSINSVNFNGLMIENSSENGSIYTLYFDGNNNKILNLSLNQTVVSINFNGNKCNDISCNYTKTADIYYISFIGDGIITINERDMNNLNCSENISYYNSIDLIEGNITMYGNGSVNLFNNWTFGGINQHIFINNGCTFNIYGGGRLK